MDSEGPSPYPRKERIKSRVNSGLNLIAFNVAISPDWWNLNLMRIYSKVADMKIRIEEA
jgi:hypothetical protein